LQLCAILCHHTLVLTDVDTASGWARMLR
jgi:hypothetical protein